MKAAPFITGISLHLALAGALAPAAALAAWLDGFAFRRQIEVDGSKIDAPLTNFPALVRLTTDNFDFAKARPDGFDVRFAAADGLTLLAHERERHNAATEASEYWVKLPLVTDVSNTVFYMYYGNPSAPDGADATNVWDAHFAGVWHKNDLTAGSIKDSTANANNGAKKAVNEPVESDGMIGKAQQYDGTNDYSQIGHVPGVNPTNAITVSAWIYPHATANNEGIVSKYWSPDQRAYDLILRSNRIYVHFSRDGSWNMGVTADQLISSASLSPDTWYHISAVIKAGDFMRIYINGNLDAEKGTTIAPIYLTTQPLRLGVDFDLATASRFFRGVIDEVRLSDIIRPSAWIEADYRSGAGALLIHGGEEAEPKSGFFYSEFF